MIHTVYLTTNLVNGKQYIGDHSTDNLDDNYLGSGLLIVKAIKKYGNINFKKKILEQFSSKNEAFNAQEKYIKKYNTLNPNGYNISPKGGHNVKGCFAKESLIKISINRKGKCVGKDHPNWNKPLSNETKLKIGKANKENSAGIKNGMYNNSSYNIWIEKYGKEEADKRKQTQNNKIRNTILGTKRSQSTKDNCKTAALKREKYKCDHCGKFFDAGNLKQHQNKLNRVKENLTQI